MTTSIETPEANTFINVSKALRNAVDFIIYVSPKNEKPTMMLHRKFDEPIVEYDNKFNQETMEEFIRSNMLPLLGEISNRNYSQYLELGRDITWIMYNYEKPEDVEKINSIKDILKSYRDKLSFLQLNSVLWGETARRVGFNDETPYFVVESITTHKFYPMRSEFSHKNVQEYFENIVKNAVDPLIKSQDPPLTNDEPVKVVVRSTFDSIVLDPKKHVFLAIVAPWCKHCKKFEPVLDSIAEHFKDNENVVIAKIDGTLNDLDFDVESFPTIQFYKAVTNGEKTSVVYTLNRTFDDVVNFINTSITQDQESHHDEL